MIPNDNFAGLFLSEATVRLGEIHWIILKAARAMDQQRWKKVQGQFGYHPENTELGKEIGMDEIHWWVFSMEPAVEELLAKSEETLKAAQALKVGAVELKNGETKSYESILARLRGFAEKHRADLDVLHDYVAWLENRHPLAPRILFTYRVWGSTRMSDRHLDIDDEGTPSSNPDKLQVVTETAWGIRSSGWLVHERVNAEIQLEIFDSMDPETFPDDGVITVSPERLARRSAAEIYENCLTYFVEIRDSLRNIILDIKQRKAQNEIFQNEKFWHDFIVKAARAKTTEPQLWDFKETLTIWQDLKGRADRTKAKVRFAEDVASFANSSGGVLIVGVSDKREIVGTATGKDLENKLKFARDVLATYIKYDREIVSFRQVIVPKEREERICVVILVSQACTAVGVDNGAGEHSYPVRRETGISRVSKEKVPVWGLHLKSDSRAFLQELYQFVIEK